jgi:acyl-CoA synthetase (AMP-forming)/AMP-acid ligase II
MTASVCLRRVEEEARSADVSLASYVFEHAWWWPNKPALIDGLTGASLTCRELTAAVDRVAAGLVARGVVKGDVVALCAPTAPSL